MTSNLPFLLEIVQAATNNPHIAEERGFNIDDSGVNEEDKCVV
jgi:PAB1-binding protein PBP1